MKRRVNSVRHAKQHLLVTVTVQYHPSLPAEVLRYFEKPIRPPFLVPGPFLCHPHPTQVGWPLPPSWAP